MKRKRKDDSWIAEGVFGELAELFLPRAQTLIYLDMDWTTCHGSLMIRGSESSRQLDSVKAEENFRNLVFWAEQYWVRTDLRSHAGHLQLFDGFSGLKFKPITRAAANEFIKQQKTNVKA
jgi:hypothetical protein